MKLLKIVTILFVLIILLTSSMVQAMTIVLDPGHGGKDPGAVNGSVYERDVTLKIANYLKEYLQPYENVNVVLTHSGFSTGELMVFERSIIARKNKADLFVSLHINSAETSSVNGAEIYVSANNSLEKYNKKTTELANKILSKLSSIGISNRGVKTRLIPTDTTDVYTDGTRADYYGIIRYAMRGTMIDSGRVTVIQDGKKVDVPPSTSANVQNGEGVPTLLIEHCYINGKDLQYIDSDQDIKKIAKADADAIIEYYGLKLKSQETPKSNIKIDNKKLIIKTAPAVTVEKLTKQLNVTQYSIMDLEGKILEKKNENIVTGYKLKAGDKTYTLIKMGDVNGDGKILAVDALAILKHSIGKVKLDEIHQLAADVNEDNHILAVDALMVLKHSIGKISIEI